MLWVCDDCTTRYAATLAACPHCGSEDRVAAHVVDEPQPGSEPAGPEPEAIV